MRDRWGFLLPPRGGVPKTRKGAGVKKLLSQRDKVIKWSQYCITCENLYKDQKAGLVGKPHAALVAKELRTLEVNL